MRSDGLDLEVNPEVSLRFGGGFQPTADIVVWAPNAEARAMDGPVPGELVKLVVEVADASIGDDHYRWRKAVFFGEPVGSLTFDGVVADTAALRG